MAERFKPTPAMQEFGMGVNSVFSRFKPPEGMENDPAYTVSAQRGIREAQDAEFAQAERQRMMDMRAAEDRAIQEIGDDPDQIPDVFARNPQLVRSPSFGQFDQVRRSVIPSRAQQTLAPSLRLKLDSADRTIFDEVLGQTGSAMEAYDAAQNRGAQERDYADLVKSGVPLNEVERYRGEGKRLSPVEKESLIRQHTVKSQDHPMKGAYDLAVKDLFENWTDTEGKTFTSQPVEAQSKMIQNLRRGYGLDPAPAISTGPNSSPGGATIPIVPAAAKQDLSTLSYTDLVGRASKQNVPPDPEVEAINQAWSGAKKNLSDRMADVVPDQVIPGTDINQREAFARAILKGERVVDNNGIPNEYGELPKEELAAATLRKMGVNPFDVAFYEPNNKRTGTQEVKNYELLNEWAKEEVQKAEARKAARPPPAITPELDAQIEAALNPLIGKK